MSARPRLAQAPTQRIRAPARLGVPRRGGVVSAASVASSSAPSSLEPLENLGALHVELVEADHQAVAYGLEILG